MGTPANTITTPSGFDPLNPGSIFDLLPVDGDDAFDQYREVAHLISPLYERDTLMGASRTRLRIIDYPYGVGVPAEEINPVSRTSMTVSEAEGYLVWLPMRTYLGNVITELSGQAMLERTVVVRTVLRVEQERYDLPYAVVAHNTTPFVEFYKINSATSVARLADPAVVATATGREVAISPDGSMVVYQQSGTEIVKTYLNDGYTFTAGPTVTDQPLNSGQMFWSKRGQYIFQLTPNVSPYYKLWQRVGNTLKFATGSLDTPPTSNPYWAGYSPDDAFLALTFSTKARIYQRLGENYNLVTEVTTGGTAALHVAWSPDGTLLMVTFNAAPYWRLYVWDAQAKTLTDISSTDLPTAPSGTSQSLEWSPGGNYLIYTTSAVGNGTASYFRLLRRAGNLLTDVETGLPTFGSAPRALQWGPYDDYLMIYRDTVPRLRFWKVDPVNDTFTLMTDPTSPTGTLYSTNTLAMWPQGQVKRTLASGATLTMQLRSMFATAVSTGVFDPLKAESTIDYNALPRLGSSPVLDPEGWSVVYGGSAQTYVDDGYTNVINLPFDLTIGGVSSNEIYVSSNGYITLGAPSDYWVPDVDNPPLPKVLAAADDLRMWDVYSYSGSYADSAYVIIRFQGNGFVDTYTVRNVIWELTIVQPTQTGDQTMELRIGTHLNTYGLANGVLVCSATTNLGSVVPAAANTSYTMTSDSSGQAWVVQAERSLANNLLVDVPLRWQTGNYAVSGVAANLVRGIQMPSETGSYDLTGGTIIFRPGELLSAATGAYAADGVATHVLKGSVLLGQTASVLSVFSDVNLQLASSGLVAETGFATVNGNPVGLVYGKTMAGDTGDGTVFGQDVTLRLGYGLQAETGVYAVDGPPEFFGNWSLQAYGYEQLIYPESWAE